MDLDIYIDSKKLQHGCSMIHAGFPSFLSVVWGEQTLIFQLSGFYCKST